MTLYETLGIEETATAEEIKSAFRRNASKHHPDREGGNPEKMAEINQAYEILMDPERRARYDSTGMLKGEESLEQKARAVLFEIFAKLFDTDASSILNETATVIENNIGNANVHMTKALRKQAKLERRVGKVRPKEGPNFFQYMLDQQLGLIKTNLEETQKSLDVLKKALDLLKEWEEDPLDLRARDLPPQTGMTDAFLQAFSSSDARFRRTPF